MNEIILGISAFYHDSAAAIVRGGDIVAAAQEERFTRKKHDPRFPHNSINYCLEEAFIEADEIDAIVFYDRPLVTFDRVIKSCMQAGYDSGDQFDKAMKSMLGSKLWVQDYVKKYLGTLGKLDTLLFTEHHFSHASSAFYPSPYEESAILTMDGVGEWATTSIGYGSGNNIEMINEINYPHSLGLLYSAFTYYCGFRVNSGEYKLMGLAPYGKPIYCNLIKDNLIDIKSDGSFRLNMDFFHYMKGVSMTNDNFHNLFKGNPRTPESIITQKEMDIAASIQAVTEEVVIGLATFAQKITMSKNIVLAGGVALNCVSNGKIKSNTLFDNIWIQPASGDAGGALGAALLTSYKYFDNKRDSGKDHQKGSYLGPNFSSDEVMAYLERNDYPYDVFSNEEEGSNKIADILSSGGIVGYMNGRMEFGPRSLGARSILGDPRNKETQSIMNLKIKYRESFRPFAPSVLKEDVKEYFDIEGDSPYMLLVAPVVKHRRLESGNKSDNIFESINQSRSDIPAVTHVDYSARVQTVDGEYNQNFYKILEALKEKTGFGIVVNTSFNVRGEPVVQSPKDAYLCFMRTEMDVLVMEDCILYKNMQPKLKEDTNWKDQYDLD
jgi:carbamoyltransferase